VYGYCSKDQGKCSYNFEVKECLPRDAAKAVESSVACYPRRERTQNQRGDNYAHKTQKYLGENMKVDGNAWSVYAKFRTRQDCEEGPRRDRAPMERYLGQQSESCYPDCCAEWMVSGKTHTCDIKHKAGDGEASRSTGAAGKNGRHSYSLTGKRGLNCCCGEHSLIDARPECGIDSLSALQCRRRAKREVVVHKNFTGWRGRAGLRRRRINE
jgi:hypothetical protein